MYAISYCDSSPSFWSGSPLIISTWLIHLLPHGLLENDLLQACLCPYWYSRSFRWQTRESRRLWILSYSSMELFVLFPVQEPRNSFCQHIKMLSLVSWRCMTRNHVKCLGKQTFSTRLNFVFYETTLCVQILWSWFCLLKTALPRAIFICASLPEPPETQINEPK